MIEQLEFTAVAGTRPGPVVTVYALSTCGFCKRAIAFLEAQGIGYRFIHLDKIPLDHKTEVKKELKEKYKADIAFPFATVGEDKHLVGFIEADWKLTLGING